jgi:hypothetical protein
VGQVYDVRSGSDDPYPPDIASYLASIADDIGAETAWKMTNTDVYSNFAATGEWRNFTFILAVV